MNNDFNFFNIFIVLLILFAMQTISLAQNQDEYLSDSDPGYKFIEELQKESCTKLPAYDCNTTIAECLELYEAIINSLRPDLIDLDEIKDISCSKISTRYEGYGVYKYLSGILDEVHNTANNLNLGINELPKIGSLPIRELNAGVATPSEEMGHIIIINRHFFTFANEMSKIIAMTIPFVITREGVKIDPSDEALIMKLSQKPKTIMKNSYETEDPTLLELYGGRILEFIETFRGHQLPPPPELQNLIISYFKGIEMFALAHEYGHVYYKHTVRSSQAFQLYGKTSKPLNQNTKKIKRGWLDEVQADLFAVDIIKEVAKQKKISEDYFEAYDTLYYAPSFYFKLRNIVRNAEELYYNGKYYPNPSSEEIDLANKLIDCVKKPSCDLVKFREQNNDAISKFDRHPHDKIREKIIYEMLEIENLELGSSFFYIIAEIMNQNADKLWQIVQPGFLEIHKVNKEKSLVP